MATFLLSIFSHTFPGVSVNGRFGTLASAFGSSRFAGSAYQNEPTSRARILRANCHLSTVAPLTHLEFEDGARTAKVPDTRDH